MYKQFVKKGKKENYRPSKKDETQRIRNKRKRAWICNGPTQVGSEKKTILWFVKKKVTKKAEFPTRTSSIQQTIRERESYKFFLILERLTR